MDFLAGSIQESVNRPTEQQVAHWHERLFRTALRLTGNEADAADMAQQAFCQAWQRWESFDGRCLRSTWLYRILVNCIRDWARRQEVRRSEPLDEWAIRTPACLDRGDDAVERQEQLACLAAAIDRLEDDLRRPLIATVLDGYTYDEVAEMLSIHAGTVASRIHRARGIVGEALRQAFGEDGP